MMSDLSQRPAPGGMLLLCAGDCLEVTLSLSRPRAGRALLRTNIGHAAVQREEVVALTDYGRPPLARDWHDLPMDCVAPGCFALRIPLLEVGVFEAKACFLPDGGADPEWPDGPNLRVKVQSAHAARANSMYTAFVRQFGPSIQKDARTAERRRAEAALAEAGYAVLPPSGTFRDVIRRLGHIHGRLGFRILQLLPIFPTPTTYGRMGLFGSAFAALDFLSVDPALAEFDRSATPLDQFRELADAVHARGASLFLDLPANHTGWASTLQTHHPEWFLRNPDGSFESPGAWGVVWEDLVALDYRHPALRGAMAEVFLFWCRQGVDGFRCDAGYMIPAETWRYIVARVRSEYPDTLFLLEGLGGSIETTEWLLRDGLDWAYSEIFQTPDRSAFERYLPGAMDLSARVGPLVHFAETHDNTRLAAVSPAYARMRTALAALCSHQGAFGITAGVEWFADERVDVHGAPPLRWGAASHQIDAIATLNRLLASHPAFGPGVLPRLVQTGGGNVLAVAREAKGGNLLALANLDAASPQEVEWPAHGWMGATEWRDLLAASRDARRISVRREGHRCVARLDPAEVLCLSPGASSGALDPDGCNASDALLPQRARLMALRAAAALDASGKALATALAQGDALGGLLREDPFAFCSAMLDTRALPPVVEWQWPRDLRRTVPLPAGHLLLVRAPCAFRARIFREDRCLAGEESIPLLAQGEGAFAFLALPEDACGELSLEIHAYGTDGGHRGAPRNRRETAALVRLPAAGAAAPPPECTLAGERIRAGDFTALLTNGTGAMAHVPVAWGAIQSQYDALLATNPDPAVPCDRRVFWTACRIWLVLRGYSQAIDAGCAVSFSTVPGGNRATWRFDVPCGMGRLVPIECTLSLAPGRNRATLAATRLRASPGLPDALDDATPVTLVFRPDLEARSFHEKTRAYAGPESAWPRAVHALPHGFDFHPAPGEDYAFRAPGATFHLGSEWRYQVPHPVDASRGLGASSDLFSPGWFGVSLLGGEEVSIHAGTPDAFAGPDEPAPAPSRPQEGGAPLSAALSRALDAYIVRRDEHRTVIAGYPWFLDWGRDTLIVLRGIIADGRLDLAADILREFGRFEENGTLPNMIRGRDAGNRDTSDAPLWFAVATGDLLRAGGGEEALSLDCGGRPLRDVLVSIATHYRDGTPNGIRMDPGSGLVYSPAHFTWMDTNYPAATPRAGYPVEIQALWIAALDLLADRLDPSWGHIARTARESLRRYFPCPGGWLADCLRAGPGTPAARATPEDALRPNQLYALTLGALPPGDPLCTSVLRACAGLLVPGAIRTLDDRPVRVPQPVWRDGVPLNDPANPYWGRYEGDEDTRRKPAYHNGTAWTWVFPAYCEALARHAVRGREAALSLLGSVEGMLRRKCLGQTPEILDGDSPHAPRGCDAQAWGVSEALRVLRWLERP
ncbi:MAG: amylo-alpha-1,6-glucosidase [Kiritimatiellia bacterium]|jgi:starch synthase (maltosyl-transferring)